MRNVAEFMIDFVIFKRARLVLFFSVALASVDVGERSGQLENCVR